MKSILNFLKSQVKFLIWLDIIIIIFLIILFICTDSFYEPVKLNCSILVVDPYLQATRLELSNHNLNLISSLKMRESLGANSILSSEGGVRQTRSIYIGIIGVLLTFLFNRNGNRKTYIVLLSLIILFYGLDIHLVDLIQRSSDVKQITSDALDLIVKQNPTDSIWYNINYSLRDSQFPKFHDTRIFRKLNSAFHPNIDQMVFFIFPFIAIYIGSTFPYRKKKTP